MTTAEHFVHEPDMTSKELNLEQPRANPSHRISRAVKAIRSGASALAGRAPGAVRLTQARASEATSALQRLPDSTLRWLAAGSLGVAAGFQLAGAPRLIRAAGAAPALLMGAAIALRQADEPTKGAVHKAEGAVEEGLGTLTDDRVKQLHGKAEQVRGSAQEGLADVGDEVQDAVTGYRGEDYDGS